MKRFAFTLIEILITMSIVGVIAILTIPNVANNIYSRTYITGLQATIKTLNDAIGSMKVREKVTSLEDSSIVTDPIDFFTTYIRISEQCYTGDYSSCFAQSYKSIDGTFTGGVGMEYVDSIALLPTGAAIALLPSSVNSSGTLVMSGFYVDVNGPEKPNIIGRDFFYVTIDAVKGTVGASGTDAMLEDDDTTCISGSDYGNSCVYRLMMNEWEINY